MEKNKSKKEEPSKKQEKGDKNTPIEKAPSKKGKTEHEWVRKQVEEDNMLF